MTEIDLEAALKGCYLQRKNPKEKPWADVATFIAGCVEHTTWTDVSEARDVLEALLRITVSDEVIHRLDGTLTILLHAAIKVAKEVEHLANED